MAAIEWTKHLEESILQSISSGESLRELGAKHGISVALILKKVAQNESFREQYVRAMEIRADIDFERLIEALEEEPERGKAGIDNAWVNLKRLKVDTIKWAISKRNPKKYGDKMDVSATLQTVILPPNPQAEPEQKALPKPEFED